MISGEDIRNVQSKNMENTIVIKDIGAKNKVVTEVKIGLTFEIEQALRTIEKIKVDIAKITDYNNKLRAVNSGITSDSLRI